MMRWLLIICSVAVASLSIAAEGSYEVGAPTMSARFEPDSVGIGDRTRLIIDVEQDVMQLVAFPDFDFEENSSIELMAEPRLDTVEIAGRRVKLRREYLLTAFDEGYYNMGRVAILYADKSVTDTLRSADSLLLQVGTFLIDSTSHTVFDLKPLRATPFVFREVSGYVGWGALAVVLLLLLAYLFFRLMAHFGRPVMGLFKPAPPVAPHVEAFAALAELRAERLWQEGEYKGYYSRLSDIIRTYISRRYGVSAMEMISDEIMTAVRELEIPTQCEMELREFLRDADLVKFAKAEFEASLNERYFESARLFVDMTKIVEEEQVAEEVEQPQMQPQPQPQTQPQTEEEKEL